MPVWVMLLLAFGGGWLGAILCGPLLRDLFFGDD